MLKELKTNTSIETNSDIAMLQCDEAMDQLRTIDGHATHNMLSVNNLSLTDVIFFTHYPTQLDNKAWAMHH